MQTQLPKYRIVEELIGDRMGSLLLPLLEEHWNESAKNKHLMILKPDIEKYKLFEQLGAIITLFAYVEDKIVGYSCNIIQPHMHYSDLICAYNDVLFVAKEYRNSPLGIRLIKETEKAVKAKGVKLLLWHAKENTTLAKILPKMGCNLQELIYSKEI